MSDKIVIEVLGDPVPEGSMRGFRAGRKIVIVHTNDKELKKWRKLIGKVMKEAMTAEQFIEFTTDDEFAYWAVRCNFWFVPPKHKKLHIFKTTAPDLDKLLRAVMDALSKIAYPDDARVCEVKCVKAYRDYPGVTIEIEKIKDYRETPGREEGESE